jgi:DNA-binding CsgD family transcriptional regulator
VEPLILVGTIDAEYVSDLASATRSFEAALAEAGEDRTALVRAHVAAGHWGVDALPGGPGDVEALHARAALDLLAGHEDDDPESASVALLMLVEAGFRAGRGLDLALLDRAIALESKAHLPLLDRPSVQGAIGRGLAGDHRPSIRDMHALLATAEEDGDWPARVILLRSLAWMGWCIGGLATASRQIDQALALADEIGLDEGVTWAIGAQIRAAMGQTEDARSWAERAVSAGEDVGSWWWRLRGLAAVVFLELTVGDARGAGGAAQRLADLAAEAGDAYEPGWNRIHGDLIEALIAAVGIDRAEPLTAWFEARAALGSHPWSLMASSRCRGLLEAAAGRSEEALVCFERSLAADAHGEMVFERARTLLAQGQALRRANRRRDAREALTEARRLFEACGSPPWADRAGAELASVSGRAAAATELTGTERRVAELASAGRTNKEIAGELFLSVRTVESHLSAAYRKLGVRRRTELAAAVSADSRTD